MLVDPSILQFHHMQLIMETITYGDRVIKKNYEETEKAYNRNLPNNMLTTPRRTQLPPLPQKVEEIINQTKCSFSSLG